MRAGPPAAAGQLADGLAAYCFNGMVNAALSHEWETLLARIGDDFVMHLLRDCMLFLALESGCLLHSGPSLTHFAKGKTEGDRTKGLAFASVRRLREDWPLQGILAPKSCER